MGRRPRATGVVRQVGRTSPGHTTAVNGVLVLGLVFGTAVVPSGMACQIVLAGRGGGTIDPGRHVVYEQETPMCNLFMAMLDRMDCAPEFHGDSTGLLGKLKL